MKAIVCARYGPPEVLQLTDVAIPTPKDNEVLIKVFATTANAADLRLLSADFPPLVQIPMRLMIHARKSWELSSRGKSKRSAAQLRASNRAIRFMRQAVMR